MLRASASSWSSRTSSRREADGRGRADRGGGAGAGDLGAAFRGRGRVPQPRAARSRRRDLDARSALRDGLGVRGRPPARPRGVGTGRAPRDRASRGRLRDRILDTRPAAADRGPRRPHRGGRHRPLFGCPRADQRPARSARPAVRHGALACVHSRRLQRASDALGARRHPPAAGGIIYDRHGAPVVENSPVWSLAVVPAGIPSNARERAEELVELSRVSGVAEEKLAAELLPADPFTPVTVKANLTQADDLAINERLPELPGVTIVQRSVRPYSDPLIFRHAVGYLGPLDSTQTNRLTLLGYQPDELVGKVGVEAGLESTLRGKDGWADVEVDARGQVRKVLATLPPVAGSSVYLSLDASLQRATAAALAAGLARDGKTAGASVVVDPRTGEVLAMVSLPGYDPNLFTHGISQADYNRLLNDPDRPLLNRAIAGQYAPGSPFKMVTPTPALHQRKTTPQTPLPSPPHTHAHRC